MRDGEQKASSTSGQLDPKCPDSKFRETSNIPAPSDRLQQGADSSGFAARRDKKSAYRAERTGAKLDAAQQKQAKQKTKKRPGPIKTTRQMVQAEAWRFAHGKIYQAEQENIGIEAAHRTELAGEAAGRKVSCFIRQRRRTHPARTVRKWEKRDIRAKADLQFRKLANEHPDLKKSSISRMLQKKRLKRKYQKQARETAKRGAQAAKKTALTTERLAVSVVRFFAARPVSLFIVGIILLIVLTLQACMGLFASIGGGGAGGVGGAAGNADMIYTRYEEELQLAVEQAQTDNPGYDEYRRNVPTISHNPAELLAFLTVAGDFPENELEKVLKEVFDKQYQLSTSETTETREVTDEKGNVTTKEVRVLDITVTAIPFAEAVAVRLTSEQLEEFRQFDFTT